MISEKEYNFKKACVIFNFYSSLYFFTGFVRSCRNWFGTVAYCRDGFCRRRVSVDVKVSGNPGISAMILGIEYDTSRLSLESVEKYSELSGMFEYTKKVVWVNSGDTTYDGTIFTMNFRVLDSAQSGDAEITVLYEEGDICNYDEQLVDFDIVSGGVTVINGGTGTAVNVSSSSNSNSAKSESTEETKESTDNTESLLQKILVPTVIVFAAVIAVVCIIVAIKRGKNNSK